MYLVRIVPQLVYQKLLIIPATFIRIITESYYLVLDVETVYI